MKDISLVRILPQEPRVPFINMRMIATALSVLAIIASIFLFTTRGLNYGIDFTGGTIIEIDTGAEPNDIEIREALAELGFTGSTVQGINPPQAAGIDYKYVRIGLQLQDESGEAGEGAQQEALKTATD